jgi:tetratricopeptide (TPR) repeat protein
LELDSRSGEARIGLASILSTKLADGWSPVLQEDMPRAEHLLSAAVDRGGVSNRAAARLALGLLRQVQNRLPEAESEFETAISLNPNDARTYLHLGETLLYLGQPEVGIPPLEHAIRLVRVIQTLPLPIGHWAPVSFCRVEWIKRLMYCRRHVLPILDGGCHILSSRSLWFEGRSRQSEIRPRRVAKAKACDEIHCPNAG